MKIHRTITIVFTMMMGLATAACGTGAATVEKPIIPQPKWSTKAVSLVPVEGDALLRKIQEAMIRSMEERTNCYDGTDMPVVMAPVSADGAESSGYRSTDTNIQEAGVDEADLVKVRDDIAYVVRKQALHVVRVWPTTEFGELGKIDLPGAPIGLFAAHDRLTVLVHGQVEVNAAMWNAGNSYGAVNVLTFDISDPTRPVKIHEALFEGSLVSNRRIDHRVYLIMQNQLKSVWYDDRFDPWADNCEAIVETVRAKRRKAIEARTLHEWLPLLETEPEHVGDIYASSISGHELQSVIQFDMAAPHRLKAESVLGGGSSVYVSPKKVYIAERIWSRDLSDRDDDATALHAFDVSSGAPAYFGTQVVNGHLVNQFAMSEHDDVLRVATTIGAVSRDGDSESSSGIYTFDATARSMPELGSVEELGRNETIYAVRFMGKTAYVVTFKKVDPLYVVNLANPKAPKVEGELKVPGFSTYLHPIDDGLLIGLGKSAEEAVEGDFAWFQGVKLSLFNVRQPSAPTELHTELIGTRGSNSPALYEHHAFTYDQSRRLLALPVSVFEGETDAQTWGTFAYSGLHLYEVSADGGFTRKGMIKDPYGEEYRGPFSWQGRNAIERSVILGTDGHLALMVIRSNDIELLDITTDMVSLGTIDVTGQGAVATNGFLL